MFLIYVEFNKSRHLFLWKNLKGITSEEKKSIELFGSVTLLCTLVRTEENKVYYVPLSATMEQFDFFSAL